MKKMWCKILALLLLVSVSQAGCAPVRYSLNQIEHYPNHPYFSSKNLVVREFEDLRQPPTCEKAKPSWTSGMVEIVLCNNEEWYFNSPDFYGKQTVPVQIREMMAKHLKASHLFRNVDMDEKKLPDHLLLEGKLKKFEALKKRRAGAEMVGQLGGLVGLMTSYSFKSPYEAETILMDVKLTDPKTSQTIWSGTVDGKANGDDPSDPQGYSVYGRANDSLKNAVENLTKEIANVKV